MVNSDLARTKLAYIATNLAILDARKAIPEQEFRKSVEIQYVVLHALQLAIQAALDLAAHIVADEGWDVPERSGDAFIGLHDHQIISEDLSTRLRSMAAFRKLIVHEYAHVDIPTVYKIWHSSTDDLRAFASAVTKHFSLG